MLILVLCAAAVLPTALSERPEVQNVQAHAIRSNEVGRRFPAGYATARNQGLLRFQKYEGGAPEISEDALPFLSDIYLALWSKSPFPLASASDPDPDSDSLERGVLLSRSLDQIGGGHLLRRDILDAIGGGHLLKRGNGFRALDPIGGGHLLKRGFEPRQLDAIGGGHLLRRSLSDGPTENSEGKLGFERTARNGRDFDTLLGRSFGTSKRDTRGANSVYKRNFDEIDNAGFKDYLYKRNFDEIDSAGFKDDLYKRNFDEIDNAGFQDYLYKRNFDEIDNAGFKDYLFKRNFDEIDNAGFRDYLYKRNLLEPRNDKVICTPEGCLYKKPTPGYGLKY